MRIGKTNYSDDFIKSFPNEAEFLKVAIPMFGKSQGEMQSVYRAVMPPVIAPVSAPPVTKPNVITPQPPPPPPPPKEESAETHD